MIRSRAVVGVGLAGLLVFSACSSGSSSKSSSSSSSAGAGAKTLGDPGSAPAGDPQAAAYKPTGPLIADSGFRPEVNGFAFENYGAAPAGAPPRSNLVADDVHKIYGDGVCADLASGKCDLIPEAQAWMESINSAMGGGHCYGFSVAAELLWQNKVSAGSFGAPATPALGIDNNTNLQRELAVDWAYQTLDSVRSAQITGTPNDILAKLKEVLVPNPPETYTIAIFRRDGHGGHAVTPYAIEDAGNGIDKVLIYDNNWPGVTRQLTIDTTKNTWNYVAATNPNEPSEVYEGDATTQSLSLYPTSPGQGPQPCPFCAKVAKAASGSAAAKPGTRDGVHVAALRAATPAPANDIEIYLQSTDSVDHGHLLITDPTGHHLGYLDGKFVSDIPGGRAQRSISSQNWRDQLEPDYYVPDGVKYTITLDGTALTATDNELVGVIGPSYDLSAGDINLNPGEKDTLGIAPDATTLTYNSNRPETPILELAVSDDVADYTFTVTGASDTPDSTVTLGLPLEGGKFTIDTGTSPGSATFDLEMLREDDKGAQKFDHKGITLNNSDSAVLDFGSWDNGKDLPLVITSGGQQTTENLTDQSA